MADRLRYSITPAAIVLAAGLLHATAGLAAAGDPADSSSAETSEGAADPRPDGGADQGRGPLFELKEALAAARAKLDELGTAAEIAAQAAGLQKEVRALEQENQRLAARLAQAEAALDAAKKRAEEAADELRINQAAMAERRAREAELTKAVEQSTAELAQVRERLRASREQLADARASQERANQRADELDASLEQTRTEVAAARDGLERTQEELTAVQAARARAEQERDAARQESERLETTLLDVKRSLAGAKANADELRAENAHMEEELALLREAASSATDVAQQNLMAMEEKIERLHSALQEAWPVTAEPGAGAADTAAVSGIDAPGSGLPDQTTASSAEESGAFLPSPIKQAEAKPAGAAAKDGSADARKADAPVGEDHPKPIAAYTAELPLEARLQVQGLLNDVDAKTDARGVLVTVPGEKLFAVGSDEIGVGAYDTLAKVAEIIGIYEGREVLITGHTDALGEPVYDRMLSERRADLVRTFFVDNFDIDAARLKTRGLGDSEAVAPDAAGAQRQVNPRLEVLILN